MNLGMLTLQFEELTIGEYRCFLKIVEVIISNDKNLNTIFQFSFKKLISWSIIDQIDPWGLDLNVITLQCTTI